MGKNIFYGIPLDDVGGDSATALIAIFIGFPVFFFLAILIIISIGMPIALIMGTVMTIKYFSNKCKKQRRRNVKQYKNIAYPSKMQDSNSDLDLNIRIPESLA